MRTIRTESGSTYEVDEANQMIRRVNEYGRLRGDDRWLRLLQPLPEESRVGRHVTLVLEPLGEGDATYRTTSEVVSDDRG